MRVVVVGTGRSGEEGCGASEIRRKTDLAWGETCRLGWAGLGWETSGGEVSPCVAAEAGLEPWLLVAALRC